MRSLACRTVMVSLAILVVGLTCPTLSLGDSISWSPDADGNWEDGGNWAPNPPGPLDDVTINVGGATVRTITIGTGTPSVLSLACEEDLVLSGGNLTIGTGGGAINGALTVGAGRTLTVNTGAFSANGATAADIARLIANTGATFSLPGLTTFDGGNVFNTDSLLEADGAGSQLNLANIATLSGSMAFGAEVHVKALAGGEVDLSAVPAINTGAVFVLADGTNSEVDFTALITFTDTNPNGTSRLEARNGGRIRIPILATLDFVELVIGATGVIDTAQILTYTNSTATVDGTTPDFSGMTNVQNSSFHVKGGGTVTLPGITTYQPDNIFNVDRSLKASGAGSLLDLSNFTTLSGTDGFGSEVRIEALSGGKVDLSTIAAINTGAVWVLADGTDSEVDLSALATFTDTNPNGTSRLEARNGGRIRIPILATLDFVELIIDGTGTIETAQIVTYTNSTATVDGTTPDLSGMTNVQNSSFHATGGGTITLPGITAYQPDDIFNVDRSLKASGAGSLLDLSNFTTLSGTDGFGSEVRIEALSGGKVDLSAIAAINTGAVWVLADGTNSEVDLSALATFTDTNPNGTSRLEARNNGRIRIPILTTLDAVELVIGATGTIETAQIVTYTNSTATADGATPDFSGMTNIQNSSFHAKGGGTITLPGITAYQPDDIFNVDRSLKATGAGSLLDLSNFTTLSGTDGFGSEVRIEALSGGKVDLSAVPAINTGAVWVLADGTNSEVDLSALATFTDTNANGTSRLEARNGGMISLNAAGTTSLTAVNVVLDPTGTITAQTVELLDGSTLSGTGALAAGLTNTAGTVTPGASAGAVTINGNFAQVADGTLVIEIFGTASDQFDSLAVLGNATLGGMLDVQLDAAFDLGLAMDFQIMGIDGSSAGQFIGLGQGNVVLNDNGFDLFINYNGGDGNDVVLTTTPVSTVVPEPGSFALLALGLGGILRLKRRK